jgi:hypothetical protein
MAVFKRIEPDMIEVTLADLKEIKAYHGVPAASGGATAARKSNGLRALR